ncbi:MAG: hypothetical protein JXA61_00930 [Bacteroidales bacterium]|nr:hypothetical protein [Bacteroidales bacterium]
MNDSKPAVLACPLDWGLGHASRMIPLIRQLLQSGYHVILGGSGKSLMLLINAFPALQHVILPSMTIRYSRGSSQVLKLLLQLPRMISEFRNEHRVVRQLCAVQHIDILISDNRYGLFCKNIHTILITHQISPVLPRCFRFLEVPLYRLIKKLVCRFDVCWIPDFPSDSNNLTGDLSHRFKIPYNARYIGLLSRFTDSETMLQPPAYNRKYELVVVLSGPEPQKTMLAELILNQLHQVTYKTLILWGYSGSGEQPSPQHDHITFATHVSTDEFRRALINAGTVICRPGYSSIMDLVTLRKPAILIPTPGQTEQEYLAGYVSQHMPFMVCRQKNFTLEKALEAFKREYPGGRSFDFADGKKFACFLPDLLDQKYKHHTSESQEKS